MAGEWAGDLIAQGGHEAPGGAGIGGEGDVVDITEAHEHGNIHFVGVLAEGIAEKDHHLHLTFHEAAGNLGISTHGATLKALDYKAGPFYMATGGPGCDEGNVVPVQDVGVVAQEGHHIGFFAIVGNDRDGKVGLLHGH